MLVLLPRTRLFNIYSITKEDANTLLLYIYLSYHSCSHRSCNKLLRQPNHPLRFRNQRSPRISIELSNSPCQIKIIFRVPRCISLRRDPLSFADLQVIMRDGKLCLELIWCFDESCHESGFDVPFDVAVE
jgi:hypothetical protein